MKELIKSNNFKIIAFITGIILIALVSFAIGMAVGFHKARFSYQWGENYERNFMGPKPDLMGPPPPGFMGAPGGPAAGFLPDLEGHGFRNGHGLAGTVISVSDNSLVIKDRDNQENTVSADDKTVIKQGRDNLKLSDLKTNDQVAVIGSPDDKGTVKADFIRVFSDNNFGNNSQDNNQIN